MRCCSACPTTPSAGGGRRRGRPAGRALLGRVRAGCAGRSRGLQRAPADDRDQGRRRFHRGAGRRSPVPPPRALQAAQALAAALGLRAGAGRRRRPGRVPRRGVDRRELPGHGGKRCRRTDVDRRAGPRGAAATGQGGAGELGPGSAGGADRAGGPRRSCGPSPGTARRCSTGHPNCWTCSMRWWRHRAAGRPNPAAPPVPPSPRYDPIGAERQPDPMTPPTPAESEPSA